MNNHFEMPDPQELPALVESYSHVASRRDLLAHDTLRADFDHMLTAGQALVRLLALDEKLAQPADFDNDAAWGGVRALVSATARLCTRRGPCPLDEAQTLRAQRAAQLEAHWIGDNLKFIQGRYPAQWREGQLRFERLDAPMAEGLETPRQALEGLGFTWALERLQATHAAYGRALGLTDLTADQAAAFNTWEGALAHFLSGLAYHHGRDPATYAVFMSPYEAALQEGRLRRRNLKDLREAKAARRDASAP